MLCKCFYYASCEVAKFVDSVIHGVIVDYLVAMTGFGVVFDAQSPQTAREQVEDE